MPYKYESLDVPTDVQNCISTYQNDPQAMLDCIRIAMGYPPVSSGTIPTVDNNTVLCLKSIFDQFKGEMDINGHMRLPFQSVLTMINQTRACLGLPALNIPHISNCIMTTCMMGISPGMMADISDCVRNCVSQNQY